MARVFDLFEVNSEIRNMPYLVFMKVLCKFNDKLIRSLSLCVKLLAYITLSVSIISRLF
jgi:hypothetical protein